MDPDEQYELNKIINFLKDINIKIKKDNKKDFKFFYEKELSSITDYASLATIKNIKQNPEYYLSKWNIIMNHLINLDNYFFYLEKREKREDINVDLNKKKGNKKRKRQNKIKKKGSSYGSSVFSKNSNEISSSSINDSSIVDNNVNSNNKLVNYKGNKKIDISEFTLKFVKKDMKISSYDVMDGKTFEEYVKKTFFVMLLILKIDYYDFLHPDNVLYKQLMSITDKIITKDKDKTTEIKNNTEINDNMEKINEVYEIDMVIDDFYIEDLKLLLDKYPKHFFFQEQLELDSENSKKKVNIISEICKDLINGASDKKIQEKRYINIIKTFDKLRNNNYLFLDDTMIKKIIDSFMIDPNKENIFIYITNGSYFLLKYAVKTIETIFEELKQKQMNDKDVKKFIEKKINLEKIKNESLIIYNIIKNWNINSLVEKFFSFYILFNELRINKIKHCLFYIGEESGTEYEDSIVKIANLKQIVLNEDDIYINYMVKNLIYELIKIRDNFCNILSEYGKEMLKKLFEIKDEKIKILLEPFNLKKEDLFKIKIYLDENDKVTVGELEKEHKFNYDISFLDEKKMSNMIDNMGQITYDFTVFISKNNLSTKYMAILGKTYLGERLVFFYDLNKYKIPEIITELCKNLPKELIKKFCYLPPKYPKILFESDGLLNYKNLSKKIAKELGYKIDEEFMKNLMNLNLAEEIKEQYFTDIINNIDKVNKLIELYNCEKNKNSLKERYEKRMIILEENIKASVFYDFFYYSFIPRLKYEKCLEFYNIK